MLPGMTRPTVRAAFALLLVTLCGCAPSTMREGVLASGASVKAATSGQGGAGGERVTVEATTPRGRHITVDGSRIDVTLTPRGTRWLGALGGYLPGRDPTLRNGPYVGYSFYYAEAQLTFRDRAHLDSWASISPSFHPYHGDDGLYLQLYNWPRSKEIRLELYHVRIGDALADWPADGLRVDGPLVPMAAPPTGSGFHDQPPDLEAMKRWVNNSDPHAPL